jgi:hypothetical protein
MISSNNYKEDLIHQALDQIDTTKSAIPLSPADALINNLHFSTNIWVCTHMYHK